MRSLGNLIWFVCSGFWAWIGWTVAGCLLCVTIVGIPFGIQCFKIARFGLFPFGKEIAPGSGAGSLLLNVIWIVVCGWELALMHLASALALCVTVVGIPFALQSVKLAVISLFPFGARIYERY